ncbi:MAG: hypothetical protein D6732_20690 [Methanobacteriota archaeon]|nr:MAG: hypothetical protein D6732_20690 [Euryarchaeota archaeon]
MKKQFFIVLILLVGVLPTSSIQFSSKESIQIFKNPETEYHWIWDDLLDPNLPATIAGDDSVYWGSSLGPYFNSTETIAKLQLAAEQFPSVAKYVKIGESYLGKEIGAVRLSLPIETPMAVKYEFALVGAHHAREAITVVDSLFFMDRLLYNYLNGDPWTIQLLSQAEIYIVPLLNPDGLDHTAISPWQRKNMHPFDEDGDGFSEDEFEIKDVNGDNYVEEYYDPDLGMWIYESIDGMDNDTSHGEDNPGGVDLNRNYPFEFMGPGSSSDPRDDTYRGPAPLSEPETQSWARFAQQHHFFTSLSLHSGIQAIIYPWGYTSLPPPDEDVFVAISNVLKGLSGFPTWDEVGGYGVNGEWGDWMYGELDSLAFTIETFGNSRSYRQIRTVRGIDRYGGIWNYFNPEPGNIYETTVGGVQPMIDFLASVPLQGIVPTEFTIPQISMQSNSTHISVTLHINTTRNDLIVSFESENQTDLGWYPLQEIQVNSSIPQYEITAQKIDVPTRIYVGTLSQGFSFYFDTSLAETNGTFSLSPINGTNGPVDVGVPPEPVSETTSTVVSSQNYSTSTVSSFTNITSESLVSSEVSIQLLVLPISLSSVMIVRRRQRVQKNA